MQRSGETPGDNSGRSQAAGVWEQLAERLNPAYECPRLRMASWSASSPRRMATPYYMLKSPSTGTYVRLAPDEYFLLGLMDGQHQVKDLVLAYLLEYQRLAFERVAHLVAQLRQYRFLVEEPRDAWGGLGRRFARRTWTTASGACSRASSTASLGSAASTP